MAVNRISREPERASHPAPILLVHGAWHGAWCWEEHFVPYFADQGYEVHALDLRGHGAGAGRGRMGWRIRDYVADVAAAADRLGAPPILIGHSMGGFIVQKYLARHPAAAAVFLAAVPPRGALRATLRALALNPLGLAHGIATGQLGPLVATPDRARALFFSMDAPADRVAAHHRRLNNESFLAFLDMLLLDLPDPSRVKVPVLVLGADEDTVIGRGDVVATARAYGTAAEFFPMAHDMMLEDGWEAVAARIVAWLTDLGL